MSRSSIFAVALALTSTLGLTAAAPAYAVLPDGLTAKQKAVVAEIEDTLSHMTTVSADFVQVATNPDGSSDTEQGKIEINRPGKMRIDYAKPSPILLVADGTMLAFVDRTLKQVTFVPLGSTPASIFLRPSVSFKDPDVIVTAVREKDQVAEVDVQLASDPSSGTLTMIFAEHPFALRQWRVKDAQGIVTELTLDNIKTGMTFDPNDFYQPNIAPTKSAPK